MFVRFKRVISDGGRPDSANAKIFCQGGCGIRLHCPWRPRCRWRIGAEFNGGLVPFRLQVLLVGNTRREGKVRQEHIAHLGDIAGHLLPSFYDDLPLGAAKDMQGSEWERASLVARIEFWKECKPRLNKLQNRLGPDLPRIRQSIHQRIPWPMKEGLERLEVLGAEEDEKFWRGMTNSTLKSIEHYERVIADAVSNITVAFSV